MRRRPTPPTIAARRSRSCSLPEITHLGFGAKMTITASSDALSDSARGFLAGPHHLLIGGERRPAADGRTFDVVDPATAEPIASVAHGGTEDVDAAVAAAR